MLPLFLVVAEKLRYDARTGAWVSPVGSEEETAFAKTERRIHRREDDYFWGGFTVGLAVVGVMWILVIGMAVLLGNP